MGNVYRAHDLSLDRPVALKVIAKDLMRDTSMRERFFREARAQARLSHPNVVQIYYIGEQDNLCFFAMELIEGHALDAPLLRGERLSPEQAIEHMIAVANALSLAHRRGFIHRDIKPSNLLLDESGLIKVADFGLAKQVESDVQLTQQGAVMGSPLYISPEQGRGDAVDFRSDIYSLGATFYHLLAGNPPFVAQTPIGVITKHITQPLPPLQRQAPDVPQALVAIVERMLEKDPGQRYQSYEELLEALRAARPQATATAGFWVRCMAQSADLLLFLVFSGATKWLAWVIYPLYCVGCWWRNGQTAGKWLFRLQVRTLDNQLPSLGRSIIRFLCLYSGPLAAFLLFLLGQLTVGSPNGLRFTAHSSADFARFGLEAMRRHGPIALLVLGYTLIGLAYLAMTLWVGFRRDLRGVHDLAAGTIVVYNIGKK
jgi:uncharacterized RDD family membrane protein YckC